MEAESAAARRDAERFDARERRDERKRVQAEEAEERRARKACKKGKEKEGVKSCGCRQYVYVLLWLDATVWRQEAVPIHAVEPHVPRACRRG